MSAIDIRQLLGAASNASGSGSLDAAVLDSNRRKKVRLSAVMLVGLVRAGESALLVATGLFARPSAFRRSVPIRSLRSNRPYGQACGSLARGPLSF
jgi:hypothetical protein